MKKLNGHKVAKLEIFFGSKIDSCTLAF